MKAPKQRPQGGYRLHGSHVTSRPATDKRAALWLAMRVMRRFNVDQLVITTEAKFGNAQDYLLRLATAGILRVAVRGISSRRQKAIYQLVIDNGPKAPITRRTGEVYDPNNDTLYAPGGVIKKGEGDGQAP